MNETKKILELCLQGQIFRSCYFIEEETFKARRSRFLKYWSKNIGRNSTKTSGRTTSHPYPLEHDMQTGRVTQFKFKLRKLRVVLTMAGNINKSTSNFWEKYDELIKLDEQQKSMSDNITIYTIITRFKRISSI